MGKEVKGMEGLKLLGGRVCLDFANTVDPRYGGHPREYLLGYRDLVAWAGRAGLLDEEEARVLLEAAARRPAEAGGMFERAIGLREALYAVFLAIARRGRPDPRDLETLREGYLRAMAHSRLVPSARGYTWSWREGGDALDRPLWPVACSAAELLVSGDLDRIKECPGGGDCGWLFYDSSKNASRRWCSMEGCGSRVKMRRMYARRRGRVDP